MSDALDKEVSLWRSAVRIARGFGRDYVTAFLLAGAALVLSGFAEGLGFLSLVPLVELFMGTPPEQASAVTRAFAHGLEWGGLPFNKAVVLATIVTMIATKAILLIAADVYISVTVAKVTRDLRLRMIRGIMMARWRYFTSQQAGRLTNSITTEAQASSDAAKQLLGLASAIIQTAVYIGSAALVLWEMTIIAFLSGLAMMWLMRGLVRASRRQARRKTDITREYAGRIVDWLQGIKPLKAMGLNDRVSGYLEEQTERLLDVHKRLVVADRLMAGLQEPVMVLFLVLALWGAVGFLAVPPASLAVTAVLFSRIVGRVGTVQKSLKGLAGSEAGHYAINDNVRLVEAQSERVRGGEVITRPRLESGIHFQDVGFDYGGVPALDRVSLEFPAGEFSALMGGSGAGKSPCPSRRITFIGWY